MHGTHVIGLRSEVRLRLFGCAAPRSSAQRKIELPEPEYKLHLSQDLPIAGC